MKLKVLLPPSCPYFIHSLTKYDAFCFPHLSLGYVRCSTLGSPLMSQSLKKQSHIIKESTTRSARLLSSFLRSLTDRGDLYAQKQRLLGGFIWCFICFSSVIPEFGYYCYYYEFSGFSIKVSSGIAIGVGMRLSQACSERYKYMEEGQRRHQGRRRNAYHVSYEDEVQDCLEQVLKSLFVFKWLVLPDPISK